MQKLSEIDEVLIRYADTLSPEAISFKIEGALSPAQVRARITTLLQSPDWLSQAMEDRLVTQKMRLLVVELEEMPRTSRNAEILLRGLEAVGARLDKRVAATEADLTKLYAFQGSALLDALNVAVAHMRGALTNQSNPESTLTEEQWDRAMEAGLRYAQIELSKHEERSELVA